MWLLLLVGFYVFGTITRLERRKLAVAYPEYNAALLFLFFIVLVPVGWLLSIFLPTNYSDITLPMLVYIGIGSAIWPAAGYIGFKANSLTGAGLFTILTTIAPVVTVIVALAFLDETLSPLQMVALGLILTSSLLVAKRIGNDAHPQLRKGIALSLITGVIVGLGAAFEKSVLSSLEIGSYVVIGWGSQAFWALILASWSHISVRRFFTMDTAVVVEALPWVLTSIIKSVFFLGALSLASASIVVPATSFISVLVVIASYYVLNERDHVLQKLVAAVVGVIGLLLLSIS